MKSRLQKTPNDYPRITVRIDADLLSRVEKVARSGGTSVAQIVTHSIRCKLPDFEKVQSKIFKKAA